MPSAKIKAITIILTIITISSIFNIQFTKAAISENNLLKQKFQRLQIDGIIEKRIMTDCVIFPTESNILVTPFEGDDCLPSLTKDQHGYTVITWTNQQKINETYMGIAYSSDPTNKTMFFDTALVLMFEGENNYIHWDTAYITGPKSNDYNGLWGVYLDKANEQLGFYRIPDITASFQIWDEFYFWDGQTPSAVNAEISDQGFYSGKNHPEIKGPFNFYIYDYQNYGYNISQCPVLVRTDGNLNGGVQYYDGQKNEKTAPADNPDMWATNNKIHTVVQNVEKNTIIWKTIVPMEEPDYEYTPYQLTIDYGKDPAIAADGDSIVIVYSNNNEIKTAYSLNNGETWNFTSISLGDYPEITTYQGIYYIVFIDNGNLYLTSSENNGVNWSKPKQINEISGTVVSKSGSLDIHQDGIAWVDARGEDWDIYYAQISTKSTPILQIDKILGGFGLNVVLKNTGNANATNIQWMMSFNGTIFFGPEKSGTIQHLLPGEFISISSGLIFGFGPVIVEIEAYSDEGANVVTEKNSILLLFFLLALN